MLRAARAGGDTKSRRAPSRWTRSSATSQTSACQRNSAQARPSAPLARCPWTSAVTLRGQCAGRGAHSRLDLYPQAVDRRDYPPARERSLWAATFASVRCDDQANAAQVGPRQPNPSQGSPAWEQRRLAGAGVTAAEQALTDQVCSAEWLDLAAGDAALTGQRCGRGVPGLPGGPELSAAVILTSCADTRSLIRPASARSHPWRVRVWHRQRGCASRWPIGRNPGRAGRQRRAGW